MANNRINRINDDIQLALSGLLRSVKDPRVQQGLLSITRVETTGDLRQCKVYISSMGMQSEREFMRGLKSAAGWLRRELGQALNLRHTPELSFMLDHSIEHGVHITEILSELKPFGAADGDTAESASPEGEAEEDE